MSDWQPRIIEEVLARVFSGTFGKRGNITDALFAIADAIREVAAALSRTDAEKE